MGGGACPGSSGRSHSLVYDQGKRAWFRWSGKAWEIANQPLITNEAFAGIGTQNLEEVGAAAIRELFYRSFGEPIR